MSEYSVPAKVVFKNNSENTEGQVWKVDGAIVSESRDLTHIFYESGRHTIELSSTSGSKTVTSKQEIIIGPPESCVVLMTTSAGDLVMTLSEETPDHLMQFSELVASGFYDGIFFHRVIDDFMIQGGDNKSRKSGKRLKEPETIPAEIKTELLHYRGALAAARMPDDMNPDKASSGSQFYIVDGRTLSEEKLLRFQEDRIQDYTEAQFAKYIELGGAPQLDGEYTVFGQLMYGYDVLDTIAQTATDKYDKPLENIFIIKARMLN